jgi:hypothetical protein
MKIELIGGEIQKIGAKFNGSSSRFSASELRMANDAAEDAVVYYAFGQEATRTIGTGTVASPEFDPADIWNFFLKSETKDSNSQVGDALYLYSETDVELRFAANNTRL